MSFDKEQLINQDFINETAKGLFDIADSDKSGSIDAKEFTNLLIDFSKSAEIPTPSEEEIEQIIASFDSNKDGKFNLQEFTEFIKRVFEIIYSQL